MSLLFICRTQVHVQGYPQHSLKTRTIQYVKANKLCFVLHFEYVLSGSQPEFVFWIKLLPPNPKHKDAVNGDKP